MRESSEVFSEDWSTKFMDSSSPLHPRVTLEFSSWISGSVAVKGVCVFCLGVPSEELCWFPHGLFVFSLILHRSAFPFFDNSKFYLRDVCVASFHHWLRIHIFCLCSLSFVLHTLFLAHKFYCTSFLGMLVYLKNNFCLSMYVPSLTLFPPLLRL